MNTDESERSTHVTINDLPIAMKTAACHQSRQYGIDSEMQAFLLSNFTSVGNLDRCLQFYAIVIGYLFTKAFSLVTLAANSSEGFKGVSISHISGLNLQKVFTRREESLIFWSSCLFSDCFPFSSLLFQWISSHQCSLLSFALSLWLRRTFIISRKPPVFWAYWEQIRETVHQKWHRRHKPQTLTPPKGESVCVVCWSPAPQD